MSNAAGLQLPARSWLAKLKDEDRDLFASYGEFFPGRPGIPIIREAEAQDYLYFVVRGSLTVTRRTEGGDHMVGDIPAGESVGEMSVFDVTPPPASGTVTPNEFTQLWRIDRDSLHRFIDDNPVVSNYLLMSLVRTLGERIRKMNPLLADLIEQSQER